MRKEILITCSFILLATFCFAQKNNPGYTQETIAQNSFYAELGGPGILFSANIDRRFAKSNLGFGGRIGIGFVSGDLTDNYGYYEQQSVATFPVQLNYIFGKPNSPHTFEVGAGFTVTGKEVWILDFSESSSFYTTASFMYRRQPANGGFSWRIGFTPIIAKGFIQPSGSVSFGYNF